MHRTCHVFQYADHMLLDWQIEQPNVGEESLTDWLLYTISKELPKSVRYRKFNRFEEARTTGSDWEWWFLYPNTRYFCFRVQAKLLDIAGNNYPKIAHTNAHGLQIEKLLADAVANNAIPLYALYTSVHAGVHVTCRACIHDLTGMPWRCFQSGALIRGATDIYQNTVRAGQTKVTAAELAQGAIPLPCLVCGPVASAHSMTKLISQYFSQELDAADSEMLGQHSVLPAYVRGLLEERSVSAEGESIGNLGAVLVVDLRDLDLQDD